MASKVTHFLGNEFASRAACGTQIMAWRQDDEPQPQHTATKSDVTCKRCRRALFGRNA